MRKTGHLFENYALFPNMTVAENILFAAIGTKEEQLRGLNENLKRFRLIGLENSYPHELSGAQQQRVAFARILTSQAEVLLPDEPFSALDSYLKWQPEFELAEILKSYNSAAIFVSHDKDEVFRLADKIAVLTLGKVDAINTKHELFKNPETVVSPVLTGCKNISSAIKIDDDKIFSEDGNITLTTNKKIPDDLKFIGLHENSFEYVLTASENIFHVEPVQEIEDIFSFILMIKTTDENQNLIRWEVSKDFRFAVKSDKLYIEIPADKIIFLKG